MTTLTPPTVLDRTRELVRPALRAAIDRLSPEVRPVAGYHVGFLDADGRAVEGGSGKAVRPALALLAAEAVGGRAEDALPGAVAAELVHDFSLLHDDVMDGDEERRHRPTAWTVFGVGPAVLAGDALLALAIRLLLEDPEPRRVRAAVLLNDATAALIVGQGADLAFERRDHVSVDDCLAMCGGKTGALLGAACGVGAVLGGGDDAQVRGLEAFGRHLGLAFQAVDDLLGIWGRPEVTGKPAWSDLRQRKRSLPVVAALAGTEPAASRLASLLARPELDDAAIAAAAGLVEAAGGRAFAEEEARRQLVLARQQLAALDLAPGPRADLDALASYVVERER